MSVVWANDGGYRNQKQRRGQGNDEPKNVNWRQKQRNGLSKCDELKPRDHIYNRFENLRLHVAEVSILAIKEMAMV
ncbi:hypothetical protein VNO77_43519 [Canavalia gladiata]|uniref:Uncharacterized protein n=1 Tax=Canavalia gladiata TaxID=3824 RepID=A0AAN9PQ45_CANGL